MGYRSMASGALLLALGLGLGPGPSVAQDPAPDQLVEVYGDWTLRCRTAGAEGDAAAPVCAMEQRLALRGADGRQQTILSLVLSINGDMPRLMAITPLGVDLAEGVAMSVGPLERLLTYRTCRSFGCVIRAELDGETVAGFRSGNEALFVIPLVNGQTVNATVSLAGFSAAFSRLGQF